MRAPASDLPIVFDHAGIVAGGVTILDDVSLTLASGAPTILVGPNGSGKTTLLRAAMGLMPVTKGHVSWGGRADAPPAQRAILFQRPVMLRRSVAGNLRYALAAANVARAEHEPRMSALLKLVGLDHLRDRPARKLSGGEQQRLALARALARDPAILFLDEPIASLDPYAAKSIEDAIRTVIARGVKIVMATHDLAQARRLGGEIVLLHRGRVIVSAPAEQFFIAPKSEITKKFIAGELLI